MDFERTYKLLQDFADAAVVGYRERLIDEDVIASGELVNSISAVVNLESGSYSVVMSLEEYWKYIEFGRKPGKFPPVDVIRKWITTKPILPTDNGNGNIPTENQLAFLISRKIATEGIKPRPLLSETIEDVYNEFIDELIEAFAIDVQNISFAFITSEIEGNYFKTIIIK